MDKTMVVVNPASANGRTGENWPKMDQYLHSQGLEYDSRLTGGPGDATRFAEQALKDGYTTIVSVGGDGTLNETLNGFFVGEELLNPQARLGVISCGTGSDFIRTAGIPRDLPGAAAVLRERKTRLLDVGRIVFITYEGQRIQRYFVNVAGFGLDGEVVHRVNNTSKVLGGFISFLGGTLVALAAHKSLPLRLEIDGELCYEGLMEMVAVANGQYFGSGMQIAPMAVLDSGHFAIVLVEAMSKPEIISCLPSIYKGTHLKNPHVKVFTGTQVKATSSGRVPVDIDGEQPGHLDAEFSILPSCLPFIL